MSDEIKPVEISINTTATGDGAEKTQTNLAKVTQDTDKATDANKRLAESQKELAEGKFKIVDNSAPGPAFNGPPTGTGMEGGTRDLSREADLRNAMLESETAVTAEEAKQLALLEAKREAAADIVRQVELEAEGYAEDATLLAEHIAIQRQSLLLQQQLGLSEAEALELATRRVEAESLIAAQEEAQEALNEELIAQEAERLAGEKAVEAVMQELVALQNASIAAAGALNEANAAQGVNLSKARAEMLTLSRELATGSANGRTLGAFLSSLGPSLTIAGIAAFALWEAMKHHVEEEEKLSELRDKNSRELHDQSHAILSQVQGIRSVSDEENVRVDLSKKISDAQEKQREITFQLGGAFVKNREELKAQRDHLADQETLLSNALRIMDEEAPTLIAAAEAQERLNRALGDQKALVEQMADVERIHEEQSKSALEIRLNALDNEHKKNLLLIEEAEKQGRISPAAAEQAKQNVNRKYEEDKFRTQQDERAGEISEKQDLQRRIGDQEKDVYNQELQHQAALEAAKEAQANNRDENRKKALDDAVKQEQEAVDKLNAQRNELGRKYEQLGVQVARLQREQEAKQQEHASNTDYQKARDAADSSAARDKENKEQKNDPKAVAKAAQEVVNSVKDPGQGDAAGVAISEIRAAISELNKGDNSKGIADLSKALTDYMQTNLGKHTDADRRFSKLAAEVNLMKMQIQNMRPR